MRYVPSLVAIAALMRALASCRAPEAAPSVEAVRSDFSDVREWSSDSLLRLAAEVELVAPKQEPLGTVTALGIAGGSVYVVDLFQSVLKVFDLTTGMHQRTLSRAGDGPGELRRPVAIEIDTAGGLVRLHVLDRSHQALTILDTLGTALGQIRVVGNWTGLARAEGSGRLILAGIATATYDSATMKDTRMDVIHEVDSSGRTVSSYHPFVPPTRTWEATFNNPSLAANDRVVVAGAFNTNRLFVKDRRNGRETHIDVGGPWFKPIEWPTSAAQVPGKNNLEKMKTWNAAQQMLVRVFVANNRILAQFRCTEPDGGLDFAYAVASVDGAMIAATDFSPWELLRTKGDTLYGIASDSAGTVRLQTRLLQSTP